MKLASIEKRIERVTESGCWIWMGAANRHYGLITYRDGDALRTTTAHRFVYQTLVGSIPDGLQLDHKCRVTLCVNPAHLEPVTAKENVNRSLDFRKPTRPKEKMIRVVFRVPKDFKVQLDNHLANGNQKLIDFAARAFTEQLREEGVPA